MRILLSNDDGIHAYGIHALACALKDKHEVFVVAPDAERSAYSHATSMGKRSVRFESVTDYMDGVTAYKVYGSPADAVKFACLHLDVKPDVVIAGINHGHNVGSEIMYSGTAAAAYEGAYMGAKAIAVSCATRDDCSLFDAAAEFVAQKLESLCGENFPPFGVININYPAQPALGYVFVGMGVQLFSDKYIEENGEYFLRGEPIGYSANGQDCDVEKIKENFITISPLTADRTDYAWLRALKEGGNL